MPKLVELPVSGTQIDNTPLRQFPKLLRKFNVPEVQI